MELVLLLSTCDLSSSLVGSSGSMRPILVTRALKGLGAAENGPRSVRRREGVARSADRITSQ